ncbi:MAG: phage tail tape measure protein [Pseudomonadota bacterium]
MSPSVGVDVLVRLADKLAAPLRDIEGRVARSTERMNKRLNLSLKIGGAGAAAGLVATASKRMVTGFTDSIRALEKAKGELATLGVKDLDVVTQRGMEMQQKLAGVTADAFVRAAYDIRSGISSLTDQGVADMTASAMVVAKATKGQAEQMTSLFATSYGIFKRHMGDLTDAEFGERFGASLAASVQAFKTDGTKMQQAIETAGAGAVNLGMAMTEQLTLLGMMQQQMQAGEAGTALRAFATNAARAHMAFADMQVSAERPVRVRILDEKGQLRAMPAILADLQARYGETLDAFEAAEIKDAFGTEEAIKLINALYGQEAAVRANVAALDEAAEKGSEFTDAMARAADSNWDAAMVLMGQRMDVLKMKIGDRLLPVVERLAPKIDAIVDRAIAWVDANPGLVTGIGKVVVGVGALAAIAATVLVPLGTLIAGFAVASHSLTLLGAAIPVVGGAVRALTAVFMANPITAAVAGIALGATLIYKHWEPISGFFAGLWGKVTGAFESGRTRLNSTIGALRGFDWSSLLTPEGLTTAWAGITGFVGQSAATLWDTLNPLAWAGIVRAEDLSNTWSAVTRFVGRAAGSTWSGLKSVDWGRLVSREGLAATWASTKAVLAATSPWGSIKKLPWDDLIPQIDWSAWLTFSWSDLLPKWSWGDLIPSFDLGSKIRWPSPPAWWSRMLGGGAAEAGTPEVQERAKGGRFGAGWLLTGEAGPELEYRSEGGFIAHNRALRSMLATVQHAHRLAAATSFSLPALPAGGQIPAAGAVAAASAQAVRGGATHFAPQYNMPLTFHEAQDPQAIRAVVQGELRAAEERARAEWRARTYD